MKAVLKMSNADGKHVKRKYNITVEKSDCRNPGWCHLALLPCLKSAAFVLLPGLHDVVVTEEALLFSILPNSKNIGKWLPAFLLRPEAGGFIPVM